MRRITIFLFLFFFFFGSAVAQQGSRDDYVREFPGKFHIRTFIQYRPTALVVKDENTRTRLRYSPNATPSVGFGLSLVDLGLAFAIKLPPSFALNKAEFGESRFHNLQLTYYQSRFAIDFHYFFNEGFYLNGTRNLPEIPLSQPLLRPDLMLEGANLIGIYIFQPEQFSYRSYFNQANKQVKSGGSFIGMTSLDYFSLFSDSLLVPFAYRENFASSAGLGKGDFTSLAIMPGYSHTFVMGNFYLNFSAALGPDFQYNKYNTEEQRKSQFKLEGKLNLRGGFGYDNDRLFISLLYLNRGNNYSAGGLNLTHNSDLIRFTVGHRFPETQWMKDFRESNLYQSVLGLLP